MMAQPFLPATYFKVSCYKYSLEQFNLYTKVIYNYFETTNYSDNLGSFSSSSKEETELSGIHFNYILV